MKVKDVAINTELELVGGGGTYRVTRISGGEISLENTMLEAGIDIYLNDLPDIFEDVKENYG